MTVSGIIIKKDLSKVFEAATEIMKGIEFLSEEEKVNLSSVNVCESKQPPANRLTECSDSD